MFATKVLSLLIHPLVLGMLLVGGGSLLWGWHRSGAVVLVGGILVLWIPATPVTSDWLQGTLESRYPPRPVAATPSAGAIVVLGGSVGAPRPPRVHPDLQDASDRVWHAARLYHAGKAPLIIASGGALPWRDRQYSEASVIQTLLESWGVPPDSVLLESGSANTYQNATNTATLIGKKGIDRVLLVTSALHMRRALATFREAGIRARPAATDYQVIDTRRTALDIVPSAEALAGSTAAIREYVGYLVYAWRGWIDPGGSARVLGSKRRSRPGLGPSGPPGRWAPHEQSAVTAGNEDRWSCPYGADAVYQAWSDKDRERLRGEKLQELSKAGLQVH